MLVFASPWLAALPVGCGPDPDPRPPGADDGGPNRPSCCGPSQDPSLSPGGSPPGAEPSGDTGDGCVPPAAVRINEVSATNREVLRDDLGEAPDWIELYNADTVPVDLAGWSLSDDPDPSERWTLPALTLDPGEHLVVYASGLDRATVAATWDTRVDQGDPWRYLADGPPPAGWADPGFDDGGWAEGPSGFGSGDQDDATRVTADAVYLRTTFELTADEAADLTALILHVDYDDAFVAYLDGVEVARANIGIPGVAPAAGELPTGPHEARIPQGEQPEAFDLTDTALSLLAAGTHTLAVEGHDVADSSDLSLVPFLTLGFGSDRPARSSAVLAPLRPALHTSFAVDAGGEGILLHDPHGCEADVLVTGRMYTDQSFGRQPDGGTTLGYFLEPTPGAPNTTESRPGFAAEPTFSPPPGHHPGGTEVTVTAGPLARVHLTWGGAEPTEADPAYTGPVPTGTDGEAAVLRARAFEDGLWPSPIATATYLLREPGELAIVSLVTEPANLWDEETGIYVFGPPDYDPEPPYYGANFHEDWERPVHAEAWEPDGGLAFAVDAGIEIYGGTTRAHGQKSLLIKLRSGYGHEAVEYPVFPDLGISSFERLVLRAGGNDWHGCDQDGCAEGAHLRDPLMHRLAAPAGVDVLAYRPVEVYLNGEYWGIYGLREQAEESWVAAHHGHEDIDLLQNHAKVVMGDAYAYLSMLDYLRTHDLSDPANYAVVEGMIDVDELVAYLAFEIFYANLDWPGNNIKYWRPRTPDGQWRWLMYDTDFGLGRWGRSPDNDSLGAALSPDGVSWPNPAWSTELFRLLLASPTFERRFVNAYADYMNTLLAPEVTRPVLQDVAAGIAGTMPRQLERWGTWDEEGVEYALDADVWPEEIEWIDTWLAERPRHARDHVVEHFLLRGTYTLDLDVEPPGAGTFALTAVEVDAPFTGEYFRGMPVTITAIPALGYTFDGWSDPALPADPTVEIDPDGSVSLVARFR